MSTVADTSITTSTQETFPGTWYFIVRLIAYKPLRYGLVALCWIGFHLWPLIPGLVAKAFFDTLSGSTVGLTLEGIVVVALAAGLARMTAIGCAALVGPPWVIRRSGLLRRNLLARILDRPGANALPVAVGEALSTLRDDVDTMALMTDWAFDVFAGLLLAASAIAIMLSINARVTLLVFIPIVIVILIAQLVRSQIERARERSRTATARVTGSMGEIFTAVQAIQVAGAEERIVENLRRLGDVRREAMLRDRLASLSVEAVFSNTASIGVGLTLLVATSAMRAGEFTVGDFALFATYLMQVAGYTGFLGYLTATYRMARIGFVRALTLMQGARPSQLVAHHPLYITGALPEIEPRPQTERLEQLEVRGLTVHHPGSEQGITDGSFTLKRGSFTVIVGRIGSGKTTLLRGLLGLLEAQSGEIRWNGQTVAQPAAFFVPPRTAYTPQVPTLLSGTLRENILLGLPIPDAEIQRAVEDAALARDVAGFPDGLDTVIGTRGMKLSGGQLQRTAAARMFVRTPELLVFDDLSSALDIETEQRLWARVFELDTTCLVVSHRRTVLERADQILVMENGRITARGTLAELLRTSEEMQRLYGIEPQST